MWILISYRKNRLIIPKIILLLCKNFVGIGIIVFQICQGQCFAIRVSLAKCLLTPLLVAILGECNNPVLTSYESKSIKNRFCSLVSGGDQDLRLQKEKKLKDVTVIYSPMCRDGPVGCRFEFWHTGDIVIFNFLSIGSGVSEFCLPRSARTTV